MALRIFYDTHLTGVFKLGVNGTNLLQLFAFDIYKYQNPFAELYR